MGTAVHRAAHAAMDTPTTPPTGPPPPQQQHVLPSRLLAHDGRATAVRKLLLLWRDGAPTPAHSLHCRAGRCPLPLCCAAHRCGAPTATTPQAALGPSSPPSLTDTACCQPCAQNQAPPLPSRSTHTPYAGVFCQASGTPSSWDVSCRACLRACFCLCWLRLFLTQLVDLLPRGAVLFRSRFAFGRRCRGAM